MGNVNRSNTRSPFWRSSPNPIPTTDHDQDLDDHFGSLIAETKNKADEYDAEIRALHAVFDDDDRRTDDTSEPTFFETENTTSSEKKQESLAQANTLADSTEDVPAANTRRKHGIVVPEKLIQRGRFQIHQVTDFR